MKRKLIIAVIVLTIFIVFGLWIKAKINHAIKVEEKNRVLSEQLAVIASNLKQSETARKKKIAEFDSLTLVTDSLSTQNINLKAQIKALTIRYNDSLAKLIEIPSDTIYERINDKIPAMGRPLVYPFAEIQIRGIYRNILDSDYLQDKLILTEHRLNIQDEAVNIQQAQISNLKGQITSLDADKGNIQKQSDLLTEQRKADLKTIRRAKFWGKVKTGAIIVVTTIALIK